jgi:cell division protein FtsW
MPHRLDRVFLFLVVILVTAGFFVFSSASLGLLARDGARVTSVAFNQIGLGLLLGTISLFILSRVPYRVWRKNALFLFIGSILLTLAVFVPTLGFEYNGARRWVHLGPLSFQPSEILKLGYVMYLAAWFSTYRTEIGNWSQGLLPFLGITAVVSTLMLAQPDTGTLMIMVSAGLAMFIAAGARFRDVSIVIILMLLALTVLALVRPYVMERMLTFFDPMQDPKGASYQINQSLIAIGSGELFGRGFGQSVQKFNFLPEPIGDSIFAVAAEEFGFVGSITLISLFLALALRGFRIAARAPDLFGALLTLGIIMLIITQSLVNIGAMLGILPLTGVPLIFMSHGGTALFIALSMIGVVLNVSRYAKR